MCQIGYATSPRLESLQNALYRLQSDYQEPLQHFYMVINELIAWSYSKRIYFRLKKVSRDSDDRLEVVFVAEDRGLLNFATRYREFWDLAGEYFGLDAEFDRSIGSYEFDPLLLVDFSEGEWTVRVPLEMGLDQGFPPAWFWAEFAELCEQISEEETQLKIALKVEEARARLKRRLQRNRRAQSMVPCQMTREHPALCDGRAIA